MHPSTKAVPRAAASITPPVTLLAVGAPSWAIRSSHLFSLKKSPNKSPDSHFKPSPTTARSNIQNPKRAEFITEKWCGKGPPEVVPEAGSVLSKSSYARP